MIEVCSLTKRFGRFRAVDDLSFNVAEGEAVALWGANGAGKTTVIRCLLGLLRYRGDITIADIDVRKRGRTARWQIGYVPQELAFYDDLRCDEALAFFGALKRSPRSRIAEVLAEVGLSAHYRKRVRELSGGMKQRLALAAALLADPPVLLLDELTSNLDTEAQTGFMAQLAALKKRGKTILFTSHRMDEVLALADRVIMLESGKLKRQATPDELSHRPLGPSILKVFVTEIDRAVLALSTRGFIAARNGESVHVVVEPGRNAAPICALTEEQISVHTFEMTERDALGLLKKESRP